MEKRFLIKWEIEVVAENEKDALDDACGVLETSWIKPTVEEI